MIHHVEHGWPENRRDVYGQMVKFWNKRGNLTVHEGLLLHGKQIVIPSSLRTDVLRHLHDSHQGITKTCENANSSVWWPGLVKTLKRLLKTVMLREILTEESRAYERNRIPIFCVTRMNSNHVLQMPILSGKKRKSTGNRCR